MIQDMTQGATGKILWKFTIPLFLSVVFQQLYSIADSVVAGKFAGTSALAAVGASFPVTMIYIAFSTGLNIGCSVIISQLFGQKDYTKMKTAIYTSLAAAFSLSLILMITGLLTLNPMIALLDTPKDIFKDSALYLGIYMYGLLFLILYSVCNGIFTALGDSKTPLYFLIMSSIGNILLDLLLVIVFHMGVAGVAWATFFAQGAASITAFFVLIRRIRKIKTVKAPSLFSFPMLVNISKIAIPSIIQQSFISVGNLFIQTLINGFGASVIAGYSAAVKLNTFTVVSLTTIGSGLSSFSAQNIGAGKLNRVKEGYKTGLKMAFITASVFTVIYFFFSRQVMGLFMTQSSKKALDTGILFLKIVSPFYLILSAKLAADGIIRGAGAMGAFMTATFSDLILRVLFAYILVIPFGSTGIWMSWPFGWIAGSVISTVFYKKGVWERNML